MLIRISSHYAQATNSLKSTEIKTRISFLQSLRSSAGQRGRPGRSPACTQGSVYTEVSLLLRPWPPQWWTRAPTASYRERRVLVSTYHACLPPTALQTEVTPCPCPSLRSTTLRSLGGKENPAMSPRGLCGICLHPLPSKNSHSNVFDVYVFICVYSHKTCSAILCACALHFHGCIV